MRDTGSLPTCLYRLYDVNDRLLYIGISVNLKSRYEDHRKGKFWWHLVVRHEETWFENRSLAAREEVAATAQEGPLHDGLLRMSDPSIPRPSDPFWEAVALSLRARIEAGEYPVGSKLPEQTVLAREYGVSAVSGGRALHYVGNLGFTESTRRNGSNVVVSHEPRPKKPRSGTEGKIIPPRSDESFQS